VSAPLLLEARGLGKRYPASHIASARLRALIRLLLGRSRADPDDHVVLDGIDLAVRAGESVGIIGENGAGKSTLLKLLTGVLHPSSGRVKRYGSIAALLELGAGFNDQRTGLENVRMKAALLGLSGQRLEGQLDDILAFAGLGEAIHRPIKQYSSGMVVRLGFAVVAAVRPQLLITDEILAVGDHAFRNKCSRWLDDYIEEGGTLLLVSHSVYQIQSLCRQALWLHQGRLHMAGDAYQVTQAYLAWNEQRSREQEAASERVFHADRYQIHALRCRDAAGSGIETIAAGADLRVEVELHSPDGRMPVAGVGLVRADGTPVYGVASEHDAASGQRVGASRYRFTLEFPRLALLPGSYHVRAHAMDPEGIRLIDTVEIPLAVTGATREQGLVRLEHRWL